MAFEKGQPRHPGAGRKAGTPNKNTAAVKAALEQAFDEMGGVANLVTWGKANPTEFYKIWAKLLPQEIKGEFSGPGGIPLVTEVVIEHHRVAATEQPAAGGS